MDRAVAIAAYRRAQACEVREYTRLRESVLVKFFGGCGCRMHNCLVNFERGFQESPVVVDGREYSHRELAKIVAKYNHDVEVHYRRHAGLQQRIAKHF